MFFPAAPTHRRSQKITENTLCNLLFFSKQMAKLSSPEPNRRWRPVIWEIPCFPEPGLGFGDEDKLDRGLKRLIGLGMRDAQKHREEGLGVNTWFIRERNVLFAEAVLSPLYVNYYLHLADNGIRPEKAHDEVFKRALGVFVLHLASRPQFEHISWTLNFGNLGMNLFLVGDTGAGTVTGRIFTENVKVEPENAFFQEVVRRNKEPHRSHVSFAGEDPLVAAEAFYGQSEQRPARFFETAPEHFSILSAHPDYDEGWFTTVGAAEVQQLRERETCVLLEKRSFLWDCGCSRNKIFNILVPMLRENASDIIGADKEVRVNCPRCAARYSFAREELTMD